MEEIYLIAKSLATLILISLILYYGLKLLQKYTNIGNHTSSTGEDAVKIKSMTYIDQGSKLVTISSRNKTYLLLVGNQNNILLDKYENDKGSKN